MSFADERRAIEDRFAKQFTNIPTAFENVKFERPKTEWFRLSILPQEAERITLGDNPQIHRYEGVIVVQVFTPEDTGTQRARQLADLIDTHFREAVFSYGDSGLIVCRTPRIDPIGTKDGWYNLNVLVEYRRDRRV